jgi:hypothetical protein
VPEADLSDTIAHNRGLPILDPTTIPHRPEGYRATPPDVRRARLRRFSADLRAESMTALRQAAKRDIQGELGRFAPEPRLAAALVERLTASDEALARAEALFGYAREIDQIALSDAFSFLERLNKQYTNAVEHDASLAHDYHALATLFAARSEAIVAGMARAKSKGPRKPKPKPPSPA